MNASALAVRIHCDKLLNEFYEAVDKLDSMDVFTYTFFVGDSAEVSDYMFKEISKNSFFSSIEELESEDDNGDTVFYIHVNYEPTLTQKLLGALKG